MPASSGGKGARGSAKTFARFRMLERPGAMLGLYNLGSGPTVYPFQVDATKLTNLFTLERGDLRSAMASMHSDDAAKIKECVEKAHRDHMEALKLTMTEKLKDKKGADAGKPEEHRVLVEGIFEGTDKVLEHSNVVFDGLRGIRDTTDGLPQLFLQSGGKQAELDKLRQEMDDAQAGAAEVRAKKKKELLRKLESRKSSAHAAHSRKSLSNRDGMVREADTQELIEATIDPDAALTAAAVM